MWVVVMTNGSWQVACLSPCQTYATWCGWWSWLMVLGSCLSVITSDMRHMMWVVVMTNGSWQVAWLSPCQTCASWWGWWSWLMVLGRLLDCLMSDMCLMMRVVVMTNGTWQVACVSPFQTYALWWGWWSWLIILGRLLVCHPVRHVPHDGGGCHDKWWILWLWFCSRVSVCGVPLVFIFYTLVPVSGGYSRVLWLDVAAVCVSNRLWCSCSSSHLLRHGIKELRERTRLMMTWMWCRL